MESLKNWIYHIDINNLLKIFDMQIAIGIVIIFFIFRTIFSRCIIKLFYIFTKNKKHAKESSMYKPLNTFFAFLGIYIAIRILPVSKQILYNLNKIFKIIVIFYITKAITTLVYEESFVLKKILKRSNNKAVDVFICKIVRSIIWIIFIFIVIDELGYNLSGLFAGLGIASAAVALAAQDLVKSLISGITILTDKPFVIGDWIEIGEYQGSVIDISVRSTRIKSQNNTVITIPNSIVTTSYVINWNRLTSRRFDCTLNLSLDTTSEQIKKIVSQIRVLLENNPKVIEETVQVSFNEISSFSSDIKIFLFVRETEYVKFLKVKQNILCSLLQLIEKENIDLAYPTQTLYLKKVEIEES